MMGGPSGSIAHLPAVPSLVPRQLSWLAANQRAPQQPDAHPPLHCLVHPSLLLLQPCPRTACTASRPPTPTVALVGAKLLVRGLAGGASPAVGDALAMERWLLGLQSQETSIP